jgi:flagellar biogenesis protein FliO
MDILFIMLGLLTLLVFILMLLMVIMTFKPKKSRKPSESVREDIKKIKDKILEDEDNAF